MNDVLMDDVVLDPLYLIYIDSIWASHSEPCPCNNHPTGYKALYIYLGAALYMLSGGGRLYIEGRAPRTTSPVGPSASSTPREI